MADIQHKRGTEAAFIALAAATGLKVGQIYILTDTKRIAIATTTSAYDLYTRAGEQGVTASDTEPSSPYEGQLWFQPTA